MREPKGECLARLTGVLPSLFRRNLHHVKEHQAGMLVCFFLRQLPEAVLLVEGYGRVIGIHREVTESGMGMLHLEQVFQG